MPALQLAPTNSVVWNPVEIGSEALRQLAALNIAPTPEAYRAAYDEIAGAATSFQATNLLARFGKTRSRPQIPGAPRTSQANLDAQHAKIRIQTLESRLQQLNELVCEDQLTGCLNRRGLDDMLTRELARSNRRGTPLCLAMLDLDDFKQINDSHGHCVGDEILVHLVQVTKQTLRSVDSVARFGGEEFLILLPDTTLEAAKLVLTRLQQKLEQQAYIHQHQLLPITFSAGIALRGSNESQRALIARADGALYQAKQAGKNRVASAA